MFEETNSSDIRNLSRAVAKHIKQHNYSGIVVHDIGVTISILALFSLTKKKIPLPGKIVIFNGAFSKFDVLKAHHPFIIQFKGLSRIEKELNSKGVYIDEESRVHWSKVRKMYRQIIATSLLERFKLFKSSQSKKRQIDIEALVLQGSADPYIPEASNVALPNLFKNASIEVAYSGHFPYLNSMSHIQRRVNEFLEA